MYTASSNAHEIKYNYVFGRNVYISIVVQTNGEAYVCLRCEHGNDINSYECMGARIAIYIQCHNHTMCGVPSTVGTLTHIRSYHLDRLVDVGITISLDIAVFGVQNTIIFLLMITGGGGKSANA